MTAQASAGYFGNGVPFNRFGHGPRTCLLAQGLLFENKPLKGVSGQPLLGIWRFLGHDYTVYSVLRRPGMPQGYTLSDMAADYAEVIGTELGGGPVDVIGTSTGGSICHHLAAEYPALVRRLVLHSSACSLDEDARAAQMAVRELALQGRWREADSVLLDYLLPSSGWARVMAPALARLMALGAPGDASDLAVLIQAEDVFDFCDRLGEIEAPTLVIAGALDPFYSRELFERTARGIPRGRLALYEEAGHAVTGSRMEHDVLAFLGGGEDGSPVRPGEAAG